MSEEPDEVRGSAKRPKVAILGAIALVLVWLVVGALGGAAQGKLSGVQSNDNSTFLPKGAESTLVSNAVATFIDSDTLPYLVVVERSDGGALTPQDVQAVTTFAQGIPGLPLPEIGADATLGDYLVAGSPIVPIPSQDGKALLVSVPLDAEKGAEASGDTSALVEGATAIRDQIESVLVPAGLEGYVGGPGGLIADFAAAFAGIDGILLGVALLVVLVILLIVYRSPILPFAVLLSAVFGLSAASLVVYQLALNDVITLSGQSQGILFILVVGASTDYALLLVSRFKEALHDEPSSWVALKRAWRGAVEPIVASAATVILGLLCLLLAELRSTSGLGPVGALGIAGALLASLTFLPAILLLFGRKAFWPFAPKLDHVHAEDVVGTKGLWGRVADLVGRHPRRTWVITLIVLLAAAAFAPTFKAGGSTIDETFLDDTDSIIAQRVIGEHFPAGSATPIQIVVPEADAEAALQVVTSDPGVDSAYIGLVPPAARPGGRAAEGRRRHRAGAGHDQGGVRQPGGRGHGATPAVRPRRRQHRDPRRRQRGDQPRRARGECARPEGHRPDDPARDLRGARPAAALDRGAPAARRGQRGVVRGDHRHLGARLPAHLRVREQ